MSNAGNANKQQLAGVKSALKQGKTIHRDVSPADVESLRLDGYDVSQLPSAAGGSGGNDSDEGRGIVRLPYEEEGGVMDDGVDASFRSDAAVYMGANQGPSPGDEHDHRKKGAIKAALTQGHEIHQEIPEQMKQDLRDEGYQIS